MVYAFILLFFLLIPTTWSNESNKNLISEVDAVNKVRMAVTKIAQNTPQSLKDIADGKAPFKDSKNPALYVFIYDTKVNIVAHPNNDLMNKNYKGKADLRGKLFRDEIVETAIAKGRGWVDYHYRKPGETGIYLKSTYFELVLGSDGITYIVACGRYK